LHKTLTMHLNVAWTANKGADSNTGENAKKYLQQFLPADAFVLTDQQPDVILFMSGGSERQALAMIQPERPVLLLSIRGNNAYAAATEVMAWMVSHGRFAILSDAQDAFETGLLNQWYQMVAVWQGFYGKKAGLIGRVSDWLVASAVPAERFRRQFGITLEEISWNSLPDYNNMLPDVNLLERFNGDNITGLNQTAQVLTVLRQAITRRKLCAIAVECFGLVQQKKVTACLALAQLNAEGTVAACEGDLASMAGMMLVGAFAGSVPWMANTTRITDQSLILSHCTVPFNMVQNPSITSHYETDCSLAIKGIIDATEVTIFRLSGPLDKAFIAEGTVLNHPDLPSACRTQLEIKLPSDSLAQMRNHPLGNHLVMAIGHYGAILRLACHYRGIKVIG